MNNDLYFEEDGISVGMHSINVNGFKYAMEDITSVHILESRIWRGFSIILILLGTLILIDEGTLFALGGLLVFVGFLLWTNLNKSYTLLIETPKEDLPIFFTRNEELIYRLMQALETALTDFRSRL